MNEPVRQPAPLTRVAIHRLIGGVLVIVAVAWAAWTWIDHFRAVSLHREAAEALEAGDHDALTRIAGRGLDLDRPISIAEGPAAGRTLLTMATRRGLMETTGHLLDLGADPGQPDATGVTALMLAAQADRVELVRLLLDRGADPDSVGRGRSALTTAAARGSIRTVELLLAGGADVNHADPDGRTALLAAARGTCDLETFRRLLDAGAEVNVSNWMATPLILAAQGLGGAETADDQLAKVMALVAAGADVETRDSRGATPLLHAVRYSAPATEILLAAGADPEAADVFGMSAIHHAASEGDDRTVELLLAAGADPARARGRFPGGSNALDHAKGRGDKEGKKIVERLEEAQKAQGEEP